MPKKKPGTKTTARVSRPDKYGTTTAVITTRPHDSDDAKSKKNFAAFMGLARKRFKECADDPNETKIRRESLEDLRFSVGDQWDDEIKNRRKLKRQPCMTFNMIRPAVRILTNEQRANRPSIQINPVNDTADPKVAEKLQGIMRHIEVNSMADIAYDMASDAQIRCGFGYIMVDTDYYSPLSFDQEIYIKAVQDAFSIYCGPAKEPDYSDMDYAFRVWDYTPDQYEQKFKGKSDYAGLSDFSSVGDHAPSWGMKATIRVAEYWYREFEKTMIYQYGDGKIFRESELPQAVLGSGKTIEWNKVPENLRGMMEVTKTYDVSNAIDSRETELQTVHRCLINGVEKLESSEWAGQYIPIIPVIGEEHIVDGTRVVYGIVRDAKDAQKTYNYLRTTVAETIGLASRAPWIMAEGQDEGHETEWNTANLENYSVLRYKPKSLGGQLAPAPIRNNTEPPIQALSMASQQALTDIKATTQVFDAKLGAASNETSGKAIQARQNQSDVGNYNYGDNFGRSIRFLGRILLDLIPKIYDARQFARIVGIDGKAQTINVINDPNKPAYIAEPQPDGSMKETYNLGVGEYDVTIGVGPSYQTRREQAFDMLTKLVNSEPGIMKVGGDIVLRNSDIPGAKELSDRLKIVIAQDMPYLQLDKEDDGIPIPPKVMLALNKLMKQNKILTDQLNKASHALEIKQSETEGRVKIAQIQADAKLKGDQTYTQSEQQIAQSKSEAQRYSDDVKLGIAEIAAKTKMQADALTAFMEKMDLTLKVLMQDREHAHETALQGREHQHEVVTKKIDAAAKKTDNLAHK